MGYQDYEKALKLGEKGYRQAVARGDYPYLQVLDEILSYTKIVGETSLGMVEVPLELIVGTKTKSRQWSFAHNFMPLTPFRRFAAAQIVMKDFQQLHSVQ